MSGDFPISLTRAELLADQTQENHWLADNVLHPFVNGTGLIQIYDTLANKPLDTYKVPQAKTFSTDWCVQALSSAGGAIVPYVVAGKLTGMGMRAAGEGLGLQGTAAKFLASESVAQIAGAGLYTFAQKPGEGQTRLGSAVGTMAGFAAFSGGNYFLNKSLPMLENGTAQTLALGAGRFAVGALGGLSSYEASNFVGGLQGVQHSENWQERLQSMAQGGFVNVALPVVQEGANKVLDALYSRSEKGLPIDREIKNRQIDDPDLQKLADENALARIKRRDGAQSQAKVPENSVVIDENASNAVLAHELTHLRLARLSEPLYQEIALLAKTDPHAAETAYLALRANMESLARNVENHVQARANGTSPTEVLPETLGNKVADGSRTYNQVWQAEWLKFKDDPNFRPAVEFKGSRNIGQSTTAYEKWMAEHIKIVPEDLAQKHADMASDPFLFMRATYYRWAERFPELNPELMKAPVVNSVGDLHVDNFGTWTDKKGRLIWGINDFDESSKLPYTNDLVRLLTSVKRMIEQENLKIDMKEATEAVLDGYKQSLKDGGQAFIKGENNAKLFEIAEDQMPDPDHFWHHLKKQLSDVPESKVPKDALKALKSIIPEKHDEIEIGQRQAGEGSLGRQRFVGLTKVDGEKFAAETKALLPSAADFAAGKDNAKSHLTEIMGSAVREVDPYVGVQGDWVHRSLAPTRAKIELGELSHLSDETRLLYSMGYETANVHLGTKGAGAAILKDLSSRDSSWLHDAVKTMNNDVLADYSEWKKNNK